MACPFTYVLYAESLNRIKIGRSICPKKRVAAIQTASPCKLALVGTIKGDKEQELHNRFERSRLAGTEWFDVDNEVERWLAKTWPRARIRTRECVKQSPPSPEPEASAHTESDITSICEYTYGIDLMRPSENTSDDLLGRVESMLPGSFDDPRDEGTEAALEILYQAVERWHAGVIGWHVAHDRTWLSIILFIWKPQRDASRDRLIGDFGHAMDLDYDGDDSLNIKLVLAEQYEGETAKLFEPLTATAEPTAAEQEPMREAVNRLADSYAREPLTPKPRPPRPHGLVPSCLGGLIDCRLRISDCGFN